MTFANPLPMWALALAIAGAAGVSWMAYRSMPATSPIRAILTGLRFLTLLLIVAFLMRPVARSAERDARDALVPVLVDTSRSMGIEDVDGGRRIDRARQLAETLLPKLEARLRPELLAFGDTVEPVDPSALSASARRSDLHGALAAVRERYRGRPIAGILLLSDGGDTGGAAARDAGGGPAVFPIGIGSPTVPLDREVLSVTAAESVLDHSRVDLAVSAVTHGRGTEPFDLRLLENGRVIGIKRVRPAAAGSPVREVFQVAPPPNAPAVYTIEIPVDAAEPVPENNSRSTLVQPPARRRRILLVEGAPGFEHSFIKRAWALDPSLEIDSVVRKGRNDQGRDTFYIQAARSRSVWLRNGYPARAEDLFRYDGVVLANVPGHQLTRAQLAATRSFVAERGGGLLVLGAQSFHQQGLADTPIEAVLPLDLSDRGGGVLPASDVRGGSARVALTDEGALHPIMQLGATAEETRKRWEAVPALASVAPLGGPRPGASVLALAPGPGGAPRALVAVQRYGEGRAMIFSGEAAWRWRMSLPSSDRTYDTFWRQAIRWLSVSATDPVAVNTPVMAAPGEAVPLRVVVRNEAFVPIRDAEVALRVVMPDGRLEQLRASADPEHPDGGHYIARFQASRPGVYRVTAEAHRKEGSLGASGTSLLVGGADAEMTDPRLNERVLQRLAAASGGRMLTADQIDNVAATLQAAAPAAALSIRRDLWHNGFSLLAIVILLATEWIVRRRWGLR